LPRAEYVARARAICRTATRRLLAVGRRLWGPSLSDRSNATLQEQATWNSAAARFSEQSLGKLRALPIPPRDRARVNKWFSIAERYPDILRGIAAAAAAGDSARYERLQGKRVDLTHQLQLQIGLGQCPVGSLGA
jgi:hypothetical protein